MASHQHAALDALGDPTRRAIFERLARSPCAVGEIAGELPVSRPAVSQHLKVLGEAGLVVCSADGRRRIYSLDPAGIERLRSYFEQFWTGALASFKEVVEHPDGPISGPVEPDGSRSAPRREPLAR